MDNLFEELKRRNVFRVGIAYLVVGWLMIEIVDTIAPRMAMPEWVPGLVIILVLVGLPITLFLAWAFELTPEGVKKAKDVAPEDSVTASTGQKLNYVIITTLVLALGYFIWERQNVPDAPQVETASSDSTADQLIESRSRISIAVLPFADLSAAKDQEYFGDGIAEEILNALVKLEELKVTSRTTAFSLKGRNLSVPEIAAQLDVSHILEGSIRSAGDNVRVTAQLIEVESDSHLWSESYDRKLDDIFAIQDEISAAIAQALKIELVADAVAGRERPTDNLEAYKLYLQAHHLMLQRGVENLKVAVDLLERAVELDPDFALAWIELASSFALIPSYADDQPQGALYVRAEEALERAEALTPGSAQIWAIRGFMRLNQYRFQESLSSLERAVALDPGNETNWLWLGVSLSATGYLSESIEALERAYEIAPTTGINSGWLSMSHHARGEYDIALRYVEESKALGWGSSHLVDGLLLLEAGNPEQVKGAFRLYARLLGYQEDIFSSFVDGYFNPGLRPGLSPSLYTLLDEGRNNAAFAGGLLIQDAAFLKYFMKSDGMAQGVLITWFWIFGSRSLLDTPELREFLLQTGMVDLWRSRGWPDFCRPLGDDDFECN